MVYKHDTTRVPHQFDPRITISNMQSIVLVTIAIVVASVKSDGVFPGDRAQYQFEYGVASPDTGDVKAQRELRLGQNLVGEYALREADGTTRLVRYRSAPGAGFEAVVQRAGVALHPPQALVGQGAAFGAQGQGLGGQGFAGQGFGGAAFGGQGLGLGGQGGIGAGLGGGLGGGIGGGLGGGAGLGGAAGAVLAGGASGSFVGTAGWLNQGAGFKY